MTILALVVAGGAYLAYRHLHLASPPVPPTVATPFATTPSPAPQRIRSDVNVVLITLDTFRTDRISSYGSRRVDTPNIDAFAAEGVRFTNAASAVPFTLPAHSSIMTGLYPPGHGVRENVGYVLDERYPTMAELLGKAGWATAGFVSAFVLDGRWGIGRGFDHYFDNFDLREMETPDMASVQRDGADTVAEAVRWLDARPVDRPFFVWLHLYDAHEPYTPAEPFKSEYPGRPYDAEVAYTDSMVGRFRQALEERGLLERSLVVITADHGEGLGDHGEKFHGYFVYDSTIHVALIVRPPSEARAGRVVRQAVSHVDILPTILEAVGLPAPVTLQGRSLMPLIEGREETWDRPVYSESLYPLLHYGWAPLRAIRSERFELIDVPEPELYDLAEDPNEEHNLYDQDPVRAAGLTAELATLRRRIEGPEQGGDAGPEMDERTLAQLQALGYMAGQGGVSIDQEVERERADPKERLQLHQKMMAAQSRMGEGDMDAAKDLLEEVLAEDETILDAHQMLGQIAAGEKRPQEAIRHFQRALVLNPKHERALFGLASVYADLGRFDDALAGFRRLLTLCGPDVRTSLAMADIYVQQKQLDAAAAVLGDAEPNGEAAAFVANKLGEVRVEQGRADEGVVLFERAIAGSEDFALPHFNLGVLYEERGDVRRAVEQYQRAIDIAPKYFKAQFNLGRLYAGMGDVDRAQRLWESAIESNPHFVQGYYYLAKLLLNEGGDLIRAEKLAREGIELDPDHEEGPLGYYLLADLLNRTGRGAEARQAAAKGREIQASMEEPAGR